MSSDPTPIRQPGDDPARQLADDLYAKAVAAHERGKHDRAAVLLLQAGDIGAAAALPDEEAGIRTCVFTGARASGYARTFDGQPISHGADDTRPTALQQWLRGDTRPRTGPVHGRGTGLAAALPDALTGTLGLARGHVVEVTVIDVDRKAHTVTAVLRNIGGDEAQAPREQRAVRRRVEAVQSGDNPEGGDNTPAPPPAEGAGDTPQA